MGTKLGGLKAKREGQLFETIVFSTLRRNGYAVTRLPDGCRRIWRKGKLTLIPVKSDFDYVAAHAGHSYLFDCKSFDSDRITHSQVTQHQAHALAEFSNKSICAGYLVHFRKPNVIGFINALFLLELKKGESIKYNEWRSVFLGSLESFKGFNFPKKEAPLAPDGWG